MEKKGASALPFFARWFAKKQETPNSQKKDRKKALDMRCVEEMKVRSVYTP